MIVVGKVLKGIQIIALRMAGEGDASLKDAGRAHKGKLIVFLILKIQLMLQHRC